MRAIGISVVAAAVLTGFAPEARAKPEVEACLDAYDRGQIKRDERKLREARALFLECARDVCPQAVRRDCATWIDDVDRSLGSLVFRVVDAQGKDVPEAAIYVDGEPSGKRADGWAVVIEPGVHKVRAIAAGQTSPEQEVVVAQGEKNRLVVVRFGPAPAAATETPSAPASAAPPSSGLPATTWLFGGVALAGLGTFAGLGITGKSDLDALHDECAVTRRCTSDELDGVKTRLLVADIAGAIGIVALGITTYIIIDHLSSRGATSSSGGARRLPGRSLATFEF